MAVWGHMFRGYIYIKLREAKRQVMDEMICFEIDTAMGILVWLSL